MARRPRRRTRAPGSSASLLRLQRTAGNAAVGTLIDDLAPGPDVASPALDGASPVLDVASPVLDVVGHGGGRPLESGVRSEMERSLGADFSAVRVHTDGAGDASARAVGAEAYTVGDEIVFREGRYDPSSGDGKQTLAHELTHVEQQRSGPVDGRPAAGGIAVSDPGDRFEQAASAAAEQVTAAETGGTSTATGPSVQREASEDEKDVPDGALAAPEATAAPTEDEDKNG